MVYTQNIVFQNLETNLPKFGNKFKWHFSGLDMLEGLVGKSSSLPDRINTTQISITSTVPIGHKLAHTREPEKHYFTGVGHDKFSTGR